MKYLAFIATALCFIAVVMIMILGVRLDVLLTDYIGLYMSLMATVLLAFIFSLILAMRAGKREAARIGNDDIQP